MCAKPTIAIIGGGLSGAAVAYHLAQLLPQDAAEVVVVEPRPELGRGLAYSAIDPVHRLNVPATRMTLCSDQMDHFSRWLLSGQAPALAPDSMAPSGDIFAPRHVFGTYVAESLQPLLSQGRVRHHPSLALEAKAGPDFRLTLADGQTLRAHLLVLAATHPKAALPAAFLPLRGDARMIEDPLAPDALSVIGAQERLLIVGNGLTSADIVASLHRAGHLGQITALSRHGWRSMPHGPKQGETAADFATAPATTALGLLRRVRQALARDASAGLTWHAAFDRLRAQGPAIWAALPLPQRRAFLRHLRALWDVHRFRIAPQTLAAVHAMEEAGRLRSLAARALGVRLGAAVQVTVLPRGTAAPQVLTVDRVILATGPAHGAVIASNPVLADLAAQGLLQQDPLNLGLHVTAEGLAIPPHGLPSGRLLVAGPLARGTVGELMGVPEVIAWAEHIARTAARQIARLQAKGEAA